MLGAGHLCGRIKSKQQMKKSLFITGLAIMLFTACEVEYRGAYRHRHYRGYERRHYPDHRHEYNRGYHHDEHGGEIIIGRPR